jgi:hypothetical protein
MKIIILLFAILLTVGLVFKKATDDQKELTIKHEIEQLKGQYPNVLPVVEVVAPRA